MHAFALAAVLVAAAPLKVAAPGLGAVNIDASLGAFYSEHVAQALKLAGLEVITQREMSSLLGLERQKALLGCTDAASACLTELVNALGAGAVLLGDVARSGSRLQVNLKVISALDGKTLALFTDQATDDTVLDVLTEGANKLAVETCRALGLPAPVRVAATSRGLSRKWVIPPAAVGVAGVVMGLACFFVSESAWSQLQMAQLGGSGMGVKASGQLNATLSGVGFAVGGVGLAAAVAVFLLGGSDAPPPLTATVSPSGASLVWHGVLP